MRFMNYLISKSRNAPRRFFLLVITFTILQNVLAVASDGTKNDAFNYVWPTNASRTISSSFAESRKGHYHFGIDIKTNQTEG